MDWLQIVATVLGSSTIVGLVSAILGHRLAWRKADGEAEMKFRDELRQIIREERDETKACEERLERVRSEVTEARINAARWEARCSVLETQMAEIRAAILREYVKSGAAGPSTLPPPSPSE